MRRRREEGVNSSLFYISIFYDLKWWRREESMISPSTFDKMPEDLNYSTVELRKD